jgi:hypothetical protein
VQYRNTQVFAAFGLLSLEGIVKQRKSHGIRSVSLDGMKISYNDSELCESNNNSNAPISICNSLTLIWNISHTHLITHNTGTHNTTNTRNETFFRLLDPQNRKVGQTLGIATAFMFTLPVAAFYSAQYVFREKSQPDNWAGAAAILVTNLIVAAYCVAAFREKDDDCNDTDNDGLQRNKDADAPRVGVFKQRTD